MRTISAMKTLLIAAVATSSVLLSACARSPQRLDLVALNGQPVAQAVIDQRECEAEFPFTREESTLQAYAACHSLELFELELGVRVLSVSGVEQTPGAADIAQSVRAVPRVVATAS